jgi:hypothetical protein
VGNACGEIPPVIIPKGLTALLRYQALLCCIVFGRTRVFVNTAVRTK